MADLRQGFRQLRTGRSFAVPAILGLALGIGAATSVFSMFSAMLLRPMGIEEPGRVVSLWLTDPQHGQKHIEVCYADLVEWRKEAAIFTGVALASSVNLDFPISSGSGEARQVDGTTVSGNFFEVLGAVPAVGRLLRKEDDQPGVPVRVVISHRLWRTEFGSDPSIIGRQIRSGADAVTVVGVTRPEFDFPRDVDVWATIRATWPTVEQNARLRVFRSVARLAPGVSNGEAQSRMDVVAGQIERTLPAGSGSYQLLITSMLDEIFGDARLAIWLLLGAVLVVVAIACVNAASLLLVRAAERSRELAVRAALGASRWQIIRLLFSEAFPVACAGGVGGTLFAAFGIALLARLAPPDIPGLDGTGMDGPVLAFAVALTFATVIAFGLVPGIVASRRDPSESLRWSGSRVSSSGGQVRLRSVLIASEVALCVLLLIGAGLLIRSFAALSTVDPGFKATHVLTFRVTLDEPDQESRRAMYSQVLERLRSLPGVESAAAVLLRPLSGLVGWDTVYAVRGQSQREQLANPNGNYEAISPGYFRTMGIRVVQGRDFTEFDNHLTNGVLILNESTARRHWPHGDAVGAQVRLGREGASPWLTVVGVVNDVRYREWQAFRPDFYVPYLQRAQHRTDFVVKTAGPPELLASAVRREVFAVDRNQPISNVTTMDALVDRALSRSRFNGFILGALAASALVLSGIGVFGVVSYAAAARRREIGIRMALGATRAEIARMVTWSGIRLIAAGAIAGLVVALSLHRLIVGLLYRVTPFDPSAYGGAAAMLAVTGLIACLVPAIRACATEPARVLQAE